VPFNAEALRAVNYLEICPPALRPAGERIWPKASPIRPALAPPRAGDRLPESFDALPYGDTVHLTLGTVYHSNRAVLQAALRGLRDLPVNIVVAAGPDVDPTTLGPQPAHILVESYVPYPLLLPKCRLVVSQGGFGVMLAGLDHGVPQLVIPQGADQFRNAEACRNAGAGLVLRPQQITAAAVTEGVIRLLDEPSFTVAAEAVQAEIQAMPDPDTVLATQGIGGQVRMGR
jgi:UDP:flavonoid glycosyltransferase YjiC (YdhE family)